METSNAVFNLKVDLRVGGGGDNPGVTRGCAKYQNCKKAQKNWTGMLRTTGLWEVTELLTTPAAGLDVSAGISFILGEHIVFWKASLFSVRSWHRSRWHHGDLGTNRLKLADDCLVD